MNKTIRALALMLLSPLALLAQAPAGLTTLSGAMTSSNTQACLASATGVVTPSLATGAVGSVLLIDSEPMQVLAQGATSTCFAVQRGVYMPPYSQTTAHATGAKVWILGASISSGDPSRPISTANFLAFQPYQPLYVASTPASPVTAASVSDANGTIFYSALEVDFNMLASGACLLNGATVTTDKHIYALYNAQGALLANTALAGTADSGASKYQCVAFTTPVALIGPAQYFLAAQANGTTDNFMTYASGAAPSSYPTGDQTGTFGTLPAITVTSTFTASEGPLMTLY